MVIKGEKPIKKKKTFDFSSFSVLKYNVKLYSEEIMSENQQEKQLRELSDAQLAKEIQKGSETAFDEIFRRYIRLIFSIASKYSAESFEKSDFVQEGLIGLLSACRTYDEKAGASFKNYASLCVERRFISIIKKASQRKDAAQNGAVSIYDLELTADSTTDPEEIVLTKEFIRSSYQKFREKLSKLEYEVFLQYMSGAKYSEISKNMGISEKSVDNALQRIKKKISEN